MLELIPRKDGRTFIKTDNIWMERVFHPKVGEVIVFYAGEPQDGPIKGDSAGNAEMEDSFVLCIKESALQAALRNLDGHDATVVQCTTD